MKALLLLAASGVALLGQTPPPAKAAPKSAAPAAATKSGAATKTGAAKSGAPVARTAPEMYRVKFTTTKGDITVEVHRDWAPIGADRFYSLVRSHFFDGAGFFRVVPNFVVQFGLAANPANNKPWEKAIKDDPVKQKNMRGTLVFATAGPNTRTTQLFINLKDNSASLDGMGFAPFGAVSEGMEVVDAINKEYGEQPDQGRITAEGAAYLQKNFPRLDVIKTAVVTFPESAAPAAKKAAPAAKSGAPATKSGAPAPAKKQ